MADPSSTTRVGRLMGSRKKNQLEVLQHLVTKHLADPSLTDIASSEDFAITSTERGILRYENAHLVTALDTLLMYQRDRRAKAPGGLARMRRSFAHDPRTRIIELLKRWLRTSAPNKDVHEEEVHRVCSLCRDILNHPGLFPSRNPRSFMQTLAEVYGHLQVQLREVLERDRTCAELAVRALSLSRNLISDAIAYLLLGATDLSKTDKLPSVEVVTLWRSLPDATNPLPSRADVGMQKAMKDSWQTVCGSIIAKLLSMTCTFRLFDGAGAEAEAVVTAGATAALTDCGASTGQGMAVAITPSADSMTAFFNQVREEFKKDDIKDSGLAGPFREPRLKASRLAYIAAGEAVFHLLYLLGEVLVHFQRLSDGMGDYGMIRVAPWLHPFLDAIVDKVKQLKSSLDVLNATVDEELVLAKARGQKVKKPVPTEYQLTRAHGAIQRAIASGDCCHTQMLSKAIEDLRARSAPERLPHVVEGMRDACLQLESVFSSPQFRECVGDGFPDLPTLAEMAAGSEPPSFGGALSDSFALPIEGDYSDDDDSADEKSWWPRRSSGSRGRASASPDAEEGTPKRESSVRMRAGSLGRRALDKVVGTLACTASSPSGRQYNEEIVAAGRFPPDDPDLPADGWICHHGSNGRIFWHHKSLGPPPWESMSWDGSLQEDATSSRCTSFMEPPTPPPAAAAWAPAGSAGPPPQQRARPPRPEGSSLPSREQRAPAPSWLDQSDCESSLSSPQWTPQSKLDKDTDLRTATLSPTTPVPLDAHRLPVAVEVRPTSPMSTVSGDMQAEVYRGMLTKIGWKRHDHRLLLLRGDELHVFEKGSLDQVKLAANLVSEVDQCSVVGSGILSIQLRGRRQTTRSFGGGEKAPELKVYMFEFNPPNLAASFLDEITRRQQRRRTPKLQMNV